ncbi:MAG: hypothetical protein LC808_06130 [Actinobacteria bacterium]|nr:hypothetical protein [Actinomycetota bacterium]
MDDEVQCQAVSSGAVSEMVAAYQRAVRAAARLRAGLIAAGVDPGDLSVVASLGKRGEPVVYVTVLPVVAVELSALITGERGSPPGRPHGRCRDDPSVA